MRLPRPLRVLLLVNMGLTFLCLLVEGVCLSRGLPIRYWDPFFIAPAFTDFSIFQERFHSLPQAAFFAPGATAPFTYPAPAAILYGTFFKLHGDGALNAFLAFLALGLLISATAFARALWRRGVSKRDAVGYAAGLALLAFPFWFGFQRGNIEFAVVLAIFAGLWALVAGRGYTAAGCFGLAASLKLLPAIYLGLLLYRRQYRQLLFGIAVFGAVTLLSLAFVGPSVGEASRGIAMGLDYFRRTYVLSSPPGSMGWDHSLLAFYRVFAPVTSVGATAYTALTAVAGLAVFFLRIVRMPLLNQVLCLSVAAVWMAPVSFEYTLVALYGAVGLLALACLRFGEMELRRVTPVFAMLGVLCSPLSEVIWRGVQYGGQLKCLVLGAVFLFGLMRPLVSEWDGKGENNQTPGSLDV